MRWWFRSRDYPHLGCAGVYPRAQGARSGAAPWIGGRSKTYTPPRSIKTISSPNSHVFGLWEESRVLAETHTCTGRTVNSADRLEPRFEPSSCEATRLHRRTAIISAFVVGKCNMKLKTNKKNSRES